MAQQDQSPKKANDHQKNRKSENTRKEEKPLIALSTRRADKKILSYRRPPDVTVAERRFQAGAV
jgi:hypothetical protein